MHRRLWSHWSAYMGCMCPCKCWRLWLVHTSCGVNGFCVLDSISLTPPHLSIVQLNTLLMHSQRTQCTLNTFSAPPTHPSTPTHSMHPKHTPCTSIMLNAPWTYSMHHQQTQYTHSTLNAPPTHSINPRNVSPTCSVVMHPLPLTHTHTHTPPTVAYKPWIWRVWHERWWWDSVWPGHQEQPPGCCRLSWSENGLCCKFIGQ